MSATDVTAGDGPRGKAEQGVLLDLDSTLIDSVYLHVRAWDEAFRAHGYDIHHAAIHAAIGLGGDRRLLLVAAEELGLPLTQLTMIGDAPWDARAARAAGMRAIGVTTGGFSIDQLRDAGADSVVSTPGDLVGLL